MSLQFSGGIEYLLASLSICLHPSQVQGECALFRVTASLGYPSKCGGAHPVYNVPSTLKMGVNVDNADSKEFKYGSK